MVRMLSRASVVLGVAVMVGGCAGRAEWAPPVGPPRASSAGVWVGSAGPRVPPAFMAPDAALRPKIHVFEGRTLGYELTAGSPNTFRFRWTTDNLANHTGVRRFTGSVWTPGRFLSFSPGCDDRSCDLEDGEHVSGVESVAGGQRIDWDTLAKDGWDGFSFTTDDAPLYFEVSVDGQPRPELLELVTWEESPARIAVPPFQTSG
jgi:hypothetical protein